jgi:polar amino acid transport system substrate-binding protein
MKNRGNLKAWAFAAALAAGALAAPAAGAEPLRVCADPDNLPFSKEQGPQRGMYVDLAELVGKALDRPVEYTWWYTQMQRRALRNTILQGACDAVFALPAGTDYKARGLQRSKPFLNVSYAIVAAPNFSFKSLDDLKRVHLAVQFSSTPHILLSQFEGFKTTTLRSPEEALQALAKGEVDAAFLWGPVAGYENKTRWNSRWRVTPVSGFELAGAVAVAVRRDKDALLADINGALARLEPQIAVLAEKYGFPLDAPVNLALAAAVQGVRIGAAAAVAPAANRAVVPIALVHAVNDPAKPAAQPAPKSAPAAKPPAKAASASAAKPRPKAKPEAAAPTGITSIATGPALNLNANSALGRVLFNDKCSHCHGTDGYSPVRERDVRFLKTRYSDKWPDTASATILNGRTDAGMPVWKEILKPGELEQIVGFLEAIQK